MRLRKKTIAVTTAAFVIAGTTAALAYWTTGGTGSSSNVSTTTTVAGVTLAATVADSDLTLDQSTVVTVTADNPNASAVKLGDVEIAVTTSNPGCTAADFDIAPVAGPFDVAPGSSTLGTTTLTLVNDALRNQDACQGASISLALSAAAAA